MIYFWVVFLSVGLAKVSTEAKKYVLPNNNKKSAAQVVYIIFSILSALPLIVVSAARYGVGSDFFSYQKIYSCPGNYPRMEIGFLKLIELLRQISKNPAIFFVVSSSIICASYVYWIYKESEYPAYSLLLFVICKDYFISMNGIRQYLAISIIFFGIPYLKKRKLWKFMIVVVLAMGFHLSAIVVLALYILVYYNITLKKIVFASVFAILSAKIGELFLEEIILKYTNYGRYFSDNSIFSESEFKIISFLIYICLIIVIYSIKNTVKNSAKVFEERILISAIVCGFCLTIFTAYMPNNFFRLSWYFNAFIPLYLPGLINRIKKIWLRMSVNSGIIICYSIYTFWLIFHGNQTVFPYYSLWT